MRMAGAASKILICTSNAARLTVVTGRIGSGKTTLLRTLLGLLPYQKGRDLMERRGGDRPGSLLRAAAQRLYRPGAAALLESIKDNILMGLPEFDVDLMGAVRTAVLDKDIADLDEGLRYGHRLERC